MNLPKGRRNRLKPAPKAPRLNQTELAAYLGVTEMSVRRAAEDGRITAEADGLFDPERAARDWIENRKRPPTRRSGQQGARGDHSETLVQAQTRHEKVKIAERKLKVSKLKGALIDERAVEKRVFELIRAVRERFLNWPKEIAGEVAAALGADPAKTEIILEATMRRMLEGLPADRLAAPVEEHAA